MDFEITDLTRTMLDRGILSRDMQLAYTARVVFENGDWIGLSRYDDEDFWVADCAFRANGFPLWSHGEGSRVTLLRRVNDEVTEALDAAVDEHTSKGLK